MRKVSSFLFKKAIIMRRYLTAPILTMILFIGICTLLGVRFYRFISQTPEEHLQSGLNALNEKKAVKALRHFQISAENDNAQAMYEVALLYDRGDGTKENKNEAVKWILKSAEKNYVPAIYTQAVWTERGYFPDKKKQEAIPLYEKAANAGHQGAMRSLILIYGETDKEKALHWYRKVKNEKKI